MNEFFSGVSAGDLIAGDPQTLQDLSVALGKIGEGLSGTVIEFQEIADGQWVGEAKDAFMRVAQLQPREFSLAGETFTAAASAIGSFASTLQQAIAAVTSAIQVYEAAQSQSEVWLNVRESGVNITTPDPGDSGRAQAQVMLNAAESEINDAARIVIELLSEAQSEAPRQPGILDHVEDDVSSFSRDVWRLGGQVLSGVVQGTVGLFDGVYEIAKLYVELSPYRLLLDPRGWLASAKNTEKTVVNIGEYAIRHPINFAETVEKSALNWNEFLKDPAKAIGELIPLAIVSIATDGASSLADADVDAANTLEDTAERLEDYAHTANAAADFIDGSTGSASDEGLSSLSTALRASANDSSQTASMLRDQQDLLENQAGLIQHALHLKEGFDKVNDLGEKINRFLNAPTSSNENEGTPSIQSDREIAEPSNN